MGHQRALSAHALYKVSSMRRLILSLLVAVASPMWVLVRVSFGYKLLAFLFVSNLLLGAIAYYLLEQGIPKIDGFIEARPAPLMIGVYVGSALLWAIQAFFFLFRRLAVLTNNAPVPHPWAAGGSPLCKSAKGSYDIVSTLIVLGLVYFMVIDARSHWTDLDMAIAMAICSAFLITVYVARTNENTLPLLPLFAHPKRPQRIAEPQLAALRAMPKAMRDDLAAIFSRRDPALQSIGQEKHSGGKSK